MTMIPSSGGPVRLYALLLRLRPIQQGTLMPFSGELVHGAFLHWLRSMAPDVADWLHEGQKRRLFTCSSLSFSEPMKPHLKAERAHIHLPLDPQKTYTIRLTLLLGELFPLFYTTLTQFNTQKAEGTNPPFLRLGKQIFLLEEVLLSNDDADGWSGFAGLAGMVELAAQMRFSKHPALTLEFASLTTFSRGNARIGYGMHHVMFPLSQLVFQSLLRRWEEIAPPDLVGVIQKERVEQYLQEDGVIAIDYDLKAHQLRFTTHLQRGFVGTCTYQLRGTDEPTTPDAPLTLRQQIYLLAQLAFYCGIGYKTAMGLGQSRLLHENHHHPKDVSS
jgi:CRISPR-associated endoribonuclease Cas6